MRIVFMGTPDFGVPTLEKLIKKHDVVLVVSQPDRKVGRKRVLTPSPIKEVALKHNIPVFQPEAIKDDYQEILDAKPELIVTAAYGQFVPSEVLDYPKHKAINVHASLLPKYRGGSPIHAAIRNGDEYAGVSIMYMVKKMDAGDVLSQVKVKIEADDSALTMFEKLGLAGSDLLLETVENIQNDIIKPEPQDSSQVTYAPNILRDDEKINWNQTAIEIDRHTRAYHTWPGTFSEINGTKVKIFPGKIKDGSANIGEVLDLSNEGIFVGTGSGIFVITDLQVQGKKRMTVKDFLNGNKLINKGDTFSK